MTTIFMEENMKNLKKYLCKSYEKYKRSFLAVHTALITFIISTNIVYAESNTERLTILLRISLTGW